MTRAIIIALLPNFAIAAAVFAAAGMLLCGLYDMAVHGEVKWGVNVGCSMIGAGVSMMRSR